MAELPNFITLIYHKYQDSHWAQILYEWENIIFSILIALFLSLLFYFGTKKKELIPSGLQNFLELTVESLESLTLSILGPEGKKYVPFLGTLFIYILSMNLVGLIPLMKSPSSNLNITIGLAICVFGLVQYLNIKNMGLLGFLYHLAGSPKNTVGWILAPLMFPLELITQLARPITLSLRLFGNIMGGDIFIAVFILYGIYFLGFFNVPVGFPFQLPFMILALFVGFLQALVFTLLSTIYILLSVPHLEEEHHSEIE